MTLRERNRKEAWLAIHTAAAEMALEHGLAGTTVEMIAGAAGVSRRTFFNYFSTKENAVLGVGDPTLPEDAAERLATTGRSLLEETVQLISEIVRSAAPAPESTRQLLPLLQDSPELKTSLRRISNAGEVLLEPLLLAELADRFPDRPDKQLRDEARAIIMIAGSIIRFAYTRDPNVLDDENGAALRHATATFQNAFKETM